MKQRKRQPTDFRYDTGEARVPWAAVGEPINDGDIAKLIEFLLPPRPGKEKDHRAQLAVVRQELRTLTKSSQRAGKLSLGSAVSKVEAQAARFLGVKHASFLTNATAGFEIGHKFAGLGPGDEVIVPAITFIATMSYPLSIGAKVVIADVDPATINMDPADVARKITKRTKVIMPVHIGGYPVDMDPIMELAEKHDITVIEDAAHAYGALYHGRMAGTIGHFGAFSFHEVKNINALGEGGVLVTNTSYGEQLGKARFLGVDPSRQIPNWLYDVVALESKGGYVAAGNHSSTEIQAVALLQQMKRLGGIIRERREAAQYLTARFREVEGVVPPPMDSPGIRGTYHLYLLQVDPGKAGGDIQALRGKLKARGVVEIPHFAPLYKFSIMKQLGYDTDAIQETCPVAEEVFNHRFTHLPLYKFTNSQLDYLASAVIESVEEMRAGK